MKQLPQSPVGQPFNEESHFYTCPVCRQSVDRRDLRQVMWHELPGHAPLDLDA
jgi:hypothetical protein